MHVGISPQEIIPGNTNFIEHVAFFAARLRGKRQSLFRHKTNGYRLRSRVLSECNDPSLEIRIRREREIGFTVHVEQDNEVVKIDYDIIICTRARRLKRTDKCNDGIMLL